MRKKLLRNESDFYVEKQKGGGLMASKGRTTVYNLITSDEKTAQINPENIELMEDFLAAIESLDEPYRSVSKKHFIDGKTAKEISVETKIGLKTIQTQIYRARSMLKKIIRKEDLIT